MGTVHSSRVWSSLFGGLLLLVAGCRETLPTLLVHIEDSAGLAPTQLRITVESARLATVAVTRPEVAGAPLVTGQTLRLLLPDAAVDEELRIKVDALVAGERVGGAEGAARVRGGTETRVTVALAPDPGCEGPGCGCDAASCLQGCCQDGRCVQITTLDSCGTGGATCTACNASTSDRCTGGGCGCGESGPCADGSTCVDGGCQEESTGCRKLDPNKCRTPPSPCHRSRGACQGDGTCVYEPLEAGASCDDGNACTQNDACTPDGACMGVMQPCPDPPGGECFQAGTCERETGVCAYAPKTGGTLCGEPSSDSCSASRCDGAGACEVDVPAPDGTACEECGTCKRGACTGYSCRLDQVCCPALDTFQCISASACS